MGRVASPLENVLASTSPRSFIRSASFFCSCGWRISSVDTIELYERNTIEELAPRLAH